MSSEHRADTAPISRSRRAGARSRSASSGGPTRRCAPGARDRLLQAAGEVLRRSGFRAAPLEEILERSAVARSNLYYHFEGKLDLACAVLDGWLREMTAWDIWSVLSDESSPGLERIRRFFETYEACSREGVCGCPLGKLAAEEGLAAPLRERVAAAFEGMRARFAEALRAGQADGSVRRGVDPEAAALSLVAVAQGGGLVARGNADPSRIRAAAEPLLELLAPPPS